MGLQVRFLTKGANSNFKQGGNMEPKMDGSSEIGCGCNCKDSLIGLQNELTKWKESQVLNRFHNSEWNLGFQEGMRLALANVHREIEKDSVDDSEA